MQTYCSVFGPGSILGWSLVVMGCELPATMEEEREYVRCRWGGIHGLGLKHSFKAAELLEVTSLPLTLLMWLGSLATERSGKGNWGALISKVYPSQLCTHCRWQDVSRDFGWELVLI